MFGATRLKMLKKLRKKLFAKKKKDLWTKKSLDYVEKQGGLLFSILSYLDMNYDKPVLKKNR